MLDVDATDDPLHGQQEGRFFHGYYDCYCYLPLYVTCGPHVLCGRLRTANRDAADGTVQELERIVGQIRQRWPRVRVIVRGDAGFCREDLMAWCEGQEGLDYVFGLARNCRLQRALARQQRRGFGHTRPPSGQRLPGSHPPTPGTGPARPRLTPGYGYVCLATIRMADIARRTMKDARHLYEAVIGNTHL